MTNDHQPGYGNPPRSTRFRKGQSGNPRGRPKHSQRKLPYDDILGRMMTLRIDGKEARVTVEEAFLLNLRNRGLAGDSSANRALLAEVQQVITTRNRQNQTPSVIRTRFTDNAADLVYDTLGLARLKYATDEARSRWELKPWIVEKALERLEWIGLSEDEQRIVWEATRTPRKVNWPDWWSYRPDQD